MKKSVKLEVRRLIKQYNLNCDLTEFKDRVDWDYISEIQILSNPFIREFKDKVDWNIISENQNLSESFIREFQDRVAWNEISRWQTLSESFIREFQDKVDWRGISICQILSEDFIREFQNEIYIPIYKDEHLPGEFLEEFERSVSERLRKDRSIDRHIFNTWDDIFCILGCSGCTEWGNSFFDFRFENTD